MSTIKQKEALEKIVEDTPLYRLNLYVYKPYSKIR